MRLFRRDGEMLTADFETEEAGILRELAGQVALLVQNHEANSDDPAIARLLPDGYRDDPEAAAEFRKYTVDDLAGRKVANALSIVEALGPESETTTLVRLDAEQAGAWLRSLTDIRLSLAARLGIDGELSEDDEPPSPGIIDIYDWLAYVQDSLITALGDA